MSRERFWARLARHRDEVLGISQDEIATRLHVTQQHVSNMENSSNVPDKIARLRELAAAYELEPAMVAAWAAEASGLKARQIRRENVDLRKELTQAKELLMEASGRFDAGLAEIKRFSDTYQAFHASYERMGEQLDQLTGQMAQVMQAVLRGPRRSAET